MHRLGATDPAILADSELLDVLPPTVHADYRAMDAFRRRDEATLDCLIVTLTGTADPYVKASYAAGWADLTRHEFEFHKMPGDHFVLDALRDRVCEILRWRLTLSPRPTATDTGRTHPKGG